MQGADHLDRQPTFTVKHFRYASSGSKDPFQVFARQTLLFHTKLDCFDWVRRVHRILRGLVRFDERR